MSVVVNLTTSFYSLCSYLAWGVQSAKTLVYNVTQVNNSIVAAVLSVIGSVSHIVLAVVEQLVVYVRRFAASLTSCVNVIIAFAESATSCFGNIIFGIQSILLEAYTTATDFIGSVASTFVSITMSIYGICDCVVATLFQSVANCVSVIMNVVMLFVSVGQFCAQIVSAVWHALGFLISSIAYFPVYCLECIETLKNKAIDSVVQNFNSLPKETYLGIICLCLLYFTLSNAVRYLSCEGVKLFSSRLHSRRRRPNYDWQLDRDFESDFEDVYGNDVENDVWMIPDTVDRTDRLQRNNDGIEDVTTISDDSDSSETVDDDSDVSELDDDENDDGSEDGYTVISDDSDSDTSLNSQTMSIESSDQEIEVNLPTVDERYCLRSRSTTPSSMPKVMNSPEEFEREMEKEKDKRKCVVCQDLVKSVLVMPCRHMCLCVVCADHLVRSRTVGRRVCPLCRTRIEKVMNIYV